MHYIRATLLSAVVISFISIGLVVSDPNPDTFPDDGSSEFQSGGPTAAGSDSDDELSLLFLIHRHGDRSPISYAPKDPYGPYAEQIWPTGLGLLTNRGKDRMYKLGKYLRRHYADFLGTPNPRQVYTRSSSYDRCLASAQLVLAGLYPPVEGLVWNEELPWQPVPVHEDDPMLNPGVPPSCPAREEDYEREFTAEDTKKRVYGVIDDVKSLTEKLRSEYGVEFDNVYDYADLRGTLHIEKDYNLALPNWVLESLDDLDKLSYHSELTFTKTDRMKRLFAGVVINDIVEKMNEYRAHRDGIVHTETDGSDPVKNKPWEYNYKLFHYSSHDTNIHSILDTLGVYQSQVPEAPYFGATILIELHRSKHRPDYSVKLLYLGNTRDEDKSLRELTLTNCLKEGDTTCSLDGFANFTKPHRVNENDWSLECHASTASDNGPSKRKKSLKTFLKGFVCGAGTEKCY